VTVSAGPSSPPSLAAQLPTPTPEPSTVPQHWPTYDPATLLGDRLECYDSPSFSVTEWNEAPIVPDSDRSSEAQALRRELTPGSGLNLYTWHRVATAPDTVLFAAETDAPEEALSITFIPDPQRRGDWKWRSLGTCQLRLVVEPDRSRADVFLAPARHPSPAYRVVHLMMRETACASGASPAGRVLAPTLRVDDASVTVLITVSRLPGAQDCQGVDSVPYDLVLPEPLGNRELLDGGRVPAAPIEEEPCCG
jgi:hypothetical protein